MFRNLAVCALILLFFGSAAGRECPRANSAGPDSASQVRTLEGQLIFHDDIRGWFELKLDQPQCGHSSIQLVQFKERGQRLEVFRSCRVKSRGALDFSPTGYYSLDIFQNVEKMQPIGACERQPVFTDYSKVKPDKAIGDYTVEMHILYGAGDQPIIFRVSSAGKELHPWQAYAHYLLTGGFVLYGYCADGFDLDKVFGTPEAKPGNFDDNKAEFQPEVAAGAGVTDLHLGYSCVRRPK